MFPVQGSVLLFFDVVVCSDFTMLEARVAVRRSIGSFACRASQMVVSEILLYLAP